MKQIRSKLHRLIIELSLKFLGVADLSNRFHEILICNILALGTDCKQTLNI